MTQATESPNWDEVLDRLDFQFIDFTTMADVRQTLTAILGGRVPSDLQTTLAFQRGQQLRTAAIEMDLRVDRFFRRGQSVTMLRDARGRFVAEGAANIADILESGEY